MTNIIDLHIKEEILPLFDFTLNDLSKGILIDLLSKPLLSIDQILFRQSILKGFISNRDIFNDYSYPHIDLIEVYTFLNGYSDEIISNRELKSTIILSVKRRQQIRSKMIQLVLFFYKLQTMYFNKIDLAVFPKNYLNELHKINDFFNSFDLIYYKNIIQKQKFKIRYIADLANIITDKSKSGEIKLFWERYFLLEVYLSISKGITTHGFSFPVFNNTAISFEELYHPLLKQPVKNSFSICNNVLLLTGPNMSGKSTFLKATGLSVYLGHLGLAVPASKAVIPFFDDIFVVINLKDDIISGYSHFMSEIMNLKKVVTEAEKGKRCFAIFDELFRGTDVQDAVMISATTLKGLTQFKNSIFLVSAHFHQLNDLEEVKSGSIATYYFDCQLKDGVPIFNYYLKKGYSDLKIGQILFENEGLNKLLSRSKTKNNL